MVKIKKIDATKGSMVPLILSYVVPLILMTLVQQLFNAVDIAVLGNMADTTAVASVGATSTIVHLLITGFVGISGGAKIVMSRLFGKKDHEGLRQTIETSLVVAVGFGVLVAAIGFLFSPAFLRMTNCPSECIDGAILYIRIYVMGVPAVLLYNYGTAVLTSTEIANDRFAMLLSAGCLT